MILVDYQIAHYCVNHQMVEPFDSRFLNPASLDIHLGDTFMVEGLPDTNDVQPVFEKFNLNTFSQVSPYLLQPGEFVLVATKEKFNMPCNVAAEFRLRSTYARMGYDQSLAVWLEPGWKNSVLTLEIRNNLRHNYLPIYSGMRIGQIIFFGCEMTTVKYQEIGHYNNDLQVQEAKQDAIHS